MCFYPRLCPILHKYEEKIKLNGAIAKYHNTCNVFTAFAIYNNAYSIACNCIPMGQGSATYF